ncbi:MAG: hypothetical protein GY714_21775 [Desulfobacterales bacterium]|nr:hypothetical protein [Desulfobacterales bacterium]
MKQKWPKFNDVVIQFENFLLSQQWPIEIRWIQSGGIIYWRGRMYIREKSKKTENQNIYNLGAIRDLGIAFNGVYHDSDVTWAYISSPIDKNASERLLYPESFVKLSISEEPLDVILINNPLQWIILKLVGRKWGKAPGNKDN